MTFGALLYFKGSRYVTFGAPFYFKESRYVTFGALNFELATVHQTLSMRGLYKVTLKRRDVLCLIE